MAPFIGIQLACFALIVTFLFFRARLEARPIALFRRFFLLSLTVWIGLDTHIRAYQALEYNPSLWFFIDRVPLLIVLIWPIVIQSSRDLATCLWAGRDRPTVLKVALTAFALALADVALIEPISVKSGLWHWTEPGIFSVPPIGIFGAAYLAGITIYLFERSKWRHRPWEEALIVLIAPLGTHVLLLASWWAFFRWVNVALPDVIGAIFVWLCSITLATLAIVRNTSRRVPPALLWIRLPAALFLLILLALSAHNNLPLVAYAIACVPPHIAILRQNRLIYT